MLSLHLIVLALPLAHQDVAAAPPAPVTLPTGALDAEVALTILRAKYGKDLVAEVAEGGLVITGSEDQLVAVRADLAALAKPADGELDLYLAATGPLVLPVATEPVTYLELLTEYGRLTGQSLTWDLETEQFLRREVVRLTGGASVQPHLVQSFVESMLFSAEFCLSVVHSGEPRVLQVDSLRTSQRNTARSRAVTVPSTAAPTLTGHAATIFAMTLELPHTDVRQASNSMRTMMTDANTQQLLPVGNSNTMVIVGFGPQVARLRGLLLSADEASRRSGEAIRAAREARRPVHEVITLQHGDAAALAPLVQTAALAAREPSRRPPQAGGAQGARPANVPPLQVLAEPRLNALVVTCSPDEVESIRALVQKLDAPQGGR